MAGNWEDRLAADVAAPSTNWEDRMRSVDLSPPPDPTAGAATLQIENPFGSNFDTGIPISQGVNNFLAGTGKGMTDLARGLAQKVGLYSFANAAADKALDAPLMNTQAGKLGDIAGNVAVALPAAFVPGVNTLAGSALLGGVTGLTQPATSWGNLAANTGIGGVAGLGGNLAGRAIGAGVGLLKSTIQPFFKSGQRSIADDIIRQFAPDPQAAVANIGADAGQIVPGSLPNAAEAAQTPGLAQLVKQIRQFPGSQAQADFAARDAANAAARVAAVRDVAGDAGKRAFFAADRDAVASQLYKQALDQGVDPAVLTPDVIQNIAQFQARLPPSVLQQARNLARMNGTPMTDATSLQGMHWTKMALDGLINKEAGPAGNSALLRSYMGLKNDLLTGMDALSPAYAAARKTYQAMSAPINQMDVGQALSDKLIPAIRDFGGNANLRASGFAEALRNGDIVAQRALGMPTATISDVMGPENMSTLTALGQDLARTQNANNLARAAGSDTVQNALSQNIIKNTLGPLGLPAALGDNTFLQTALRPAQWAGSLAEPRVIDQVGRTLLSPQETAQSLLRSAQPKLTDKAIKGLLRYSAPVGASGLLSNLPQQQ